LEIENKTNKNIQESKKPESFYKPNLITFFLFIFVSLC